MYEPKLKVSNILPTHMCLMTESATVAELDRADFIAETIEPSLKAPIFWFARIKAKIEHRGDGTFLMKKICRIADLMDAAIVNGINPYGDRSLEELISWFGQFGFQHVEEGVVVRMATQEQIDFVYDGVNELFDDGDFSIVNDLLTWYTTGELNTDGDRMLAWLKATLPQKDKLPARVGFFNKCKEIIDTDILEGLE